MKERANNEYILGATYLFYHRKGKKVSSSRLTERKVYEWANDVSSH